MKKSHHRLSVCVNDPSVDNIHDLRTSIRRMTTIYKILSKYLKKKKIKKFVKQYQLLFKSSSIIRDYDILSEKISFYGFSELTFIQYLKKQREKKIIDVLNQSSLLLTLEVPTISEFNFIDEINMFFTEKCLELILEIQTNFPIIIQDQTKIKELHSMRKTVKKLRYLLEFLPEDSISQILKDLKQLQDLLGDIHDNDMTILFFQKKIDKFNSLKPLILLEKESRDANFKKLVQHNSLLSTNG
ncbi:MAG: CHAD domain-containing protein [Nitrosarchaeum sp.]|nr:CHAD domain-containing protein [Nitrosarchaeum sp.]